VEGLAVTGASLREVYGGRRVLVTGHTGFKGSWLALWLRSLGAEVTGLALPPETTPNLFESARVAESCRNEEGDIAELATVERVLARAAPEFIFHLAAQALVRRSYRDPLGTIRSNILGTAHVLEAVRRAGRPACVVVVSSDKCYENREWWQAYREGDSLGGHDVYSMSKGATELVAASYRRSFFPPERLAEHGVAVATARAGNVIGGGDWAEDRIVPDMVRALAAREPVRVRSPDAVRPWQHVLEPLSGYLALGAHLAGRGALSREDACDAWNFGPLPSGARRVREVVELLISAWGEGSWVHAPDPAAPKEAGLLRLAIDRAVARLGWTPRWDLETAVARTAWWYRSHARGAGTDALRALALEQIRAYEETSRAGG